MDTLESPPEMRVMESKVSLAHVLGTQLEHISTPKAPCRSQVPLLPEHRLHPGEATMASVVPFLLAEETLSN